MRYQATGLLDQTFDGQFQGDGRVLTDFASGHDEARSVVLQPGDGKIVVAGFSDGNFAVARYNPGNGSLDSTFSGDGKVTTDFEGDEDQGHDVALQADGKIVVAGFRTVSTGRDFAVARYIGLEVPTEITVLGNNLEIVDGDADPRPEDGTDFGTVSLNATATSTFTIRNDGTAALTVSSVTVSGNFSLTAPWVSTSIPGGETRTFTVQMNTSSLGMKTGLVTINNTDSDESPYTFALEGNVTTTGGGAEIRVEGNSLEIVDGDSDPRPEDGTDFGIVAIGATATRTFTIRNQGTAALTVSSVTVSGNFSLPTPWVSTSIAAGGTATFTVQMNTATVGLKTGEVTIGNTDGNENPYTFAVEGEVRPADPEIEVRGNNLVIEDGDVDPRPDDATDFGNVALGVTETRTFTIRNDGGAALTVSSVTVSGNFSLTIPWTSTSIAAGESRIFTVQMNTSTLGLKTGEVTIANTDANENPYTFALEGNVTPAEPEIEVRGNNLGIADGDPDPRPEDGTDFGTVSLNSTATRTFTIRNDGGAALTVSSVTVSGNFSLTAPWVSTSIAAGDSRTFTVQMNTSTLGLKTGQVTIANTDSNENPYTFALEGNVTPPSPEIIVQGNGLSITDGDTTPSTSDHTDFGSVALGGAAISRTFTIRNEGSAALTLGTVTAPAGFTVTTQPATSVAAGGTTTFTVRMDTGANGTKSGELSFTTNDLDESPFNFQIRGVVGITPEIIVLGNSVSITDGDTTPSVTDHTDFGTVARFGTAIIRTFTVRNEGGAPLTLGTVTAPTGFSVTTQPATFVAAGGGTTTFAIRLDTATTGPRSGQVSFFTTDSDENPFNFQIRGVVGMTPDIIVLGNAISIGDGDTTPSTADHTDFGSVVKGGVPVDRTFTIRNEGNAALTLGTATAPNGFMLLTQPSASVGIGGTTTFTVRLNTATGGTKTGDVIFSTNDLDEDPFNFRVTGMVSTLTLLPEIVVQGNTLNIADGATTPNTSDHTDFGSVTRGGAAISRTFTVRNEGGVVLNLGTVTAPTGFTVTTQPARSVAAGGGTTTFTVRMDTSASGIKIGDVSLASDDTDENPFNFQIQGLVEPPNREIAVFYVGTSGDIEIPDNNSIIYVATDFGSVPQSGEVVTKTYKIQNNGTDTLTVTLPVTAPTGFVVQTQPATSILPGSFTTFIVRMDTAVTGTKSGELTITNDDANENPYNFQIRGTVVAVPRVTVLGNGFSIMDGDADPSLTDHTDFGSAMLGGAVVSRTFTIRNTGTASLTVGPVAVTAGSGFTVTAQPTSPIPATESRQFTVRMDTARSELKRAS